MCVARLLLQWRVHYPNRVVGFHGNGREIVGAVQIKPAFALVYVNGRYAGTAEQFTKPYRPLRIGVGRQHVEFRAPGYRTVSAWLTTDNGKVATATGAMIKNP